MQCCPTPSNDAEYWEYYGQGYILTLPIRTPKPNTSRMHIHNTYTCRMPIVFTVSCLQNNSVYTTELLNGIIFHFTVNQWDIVFEWITLSSVAFCRSIFTHANTHTHNKMNLSNSKCRWVTGLIRASAVHLNWLIKSKNLHSAVHRTKQIYEEYLEIKASLGFIFIVPETT